MKTSNDLFLFIKSLSKSEKRYFKLFASLQKSARSVDGGGKNYLKLFKSIDRQKEYDEDIIRKEFKNEKFITHLPDEKSNLFQLILKSLRVYDTDKSVDVELQGLIHNIKLLYEKGFYQQCKKTIQKAKKLAYSHEKNLRILEIINYEQSLIRTEVSENIYESIIEKITEEKQIILDKIKNVNNYSKLSDMLSILLKKTGGYVRGRSELKKYQRIINDPLLSNISKAISYDAKNLFYNLHAGYFFAMQDEKNLHENLKLNIEHIEAHPLRIEEQMMNYIYTLQNYTLIKSVPIKERIQTVYKLRSLHTRSNPLKAAIFSMSYIREIGMYLDMGEFKKGVELIPVIETNLDQYKNQIDNTIEFNYFISCLYFGTSDLRNALKWLNKVLNDRNMEPREDIHGFARILNLIIHFELGNEDILGYITKSTYRFLKKRNRLYKIETVILNFIHKKTPAIVTKAQQVDAFKELKTEIEKITKDSFEKTALGYFDLISWLEGKIENTPFAEIVRENYKKQNKE